MQPQSCSELHSKENMNIVLKIVLLSTTFTAYAQNCRENVVPDDAIFAKAGNYS